MAGKETYFKAIYKDNQLKEILVRYKKETPSGFIWVEDKIPSISEIIEIKKSNDYKGESTVSIKTYGKFEEIFQR